jgi:hypothetical protein
MTLVAPDVVDEDRVEDEVEVVDEVEETEEVNEVDVVEELDGVVELDEVEEVVTLVVDFGEQENNVPAATAAMLPMIKSRLLKTFSLFFFSSLLTVHFLSR